MNTRVTAKEFSYLHADRSSNTQEIPERGEDTSEEEVEWGEVRAKLETLDLVLEEVKADVEDTDTTEELEKLRSNIDELIMKASGIREDSPVSQNKPKLSLWSKYGKHLKLYLQFLLGENPERIKKEKREIQ